MKSGNFKSKLVKSVVTSALILGVGVGSVVAPVLGTVAHAEEAVAIRSFTRAEGESTTSGYNQVEILGGNLSDFSIGFTAVADDEDAFTWAIFANDAPDTILADGRATFGSPVALVFTHPTTGELIDYSFRFGEGPEVEDPAVIDRQDISLFGLNYNGVAFSKNNFPIVNVGGAFDPLNAVTFTDAAGVAFKGEITADVSGVNTSKAGFYPVVYTITETDPITIGGREGTEAVSPPPFTPQVATITVPVAVVNPSLITNNEETTLTVDRTLNTEANKASYTSLDGSLRFDVWNTGGTSYTLNVVNLEDPANPVVKSAALTENIASYTLTVTYDEILNKEDVYKINFNFVNSPTPGTENISDTVPVNSKVANPVAPATKKAAPTKLAQTNVAGLGMLPAIGGLTAVGGSVSAFFKSRRKK